MEHSPLTLDFAYQAIVVAQALGLAALVRVPDRSGSHLQRLLDAGADGILVPQVADAVEAERSVEQMVLLADRAAGDGFDVPGRPVGPRRRRPTTWPPVTGWCGPSRSRTRPPSTSWTPSSTRPELTAVFLGMGDLSLSSGLPASSPELQELMDRLLAAAAARQLPCGTAVGDAGAAVRGGAARLLLRDGQQRRLDLRAGREGARRRRHRRTARRTRARDRGVTG